MSEDFWREADRMCTTADLIVDRPAGSAHPRFSEWVYPLDYGYLADTSGGDGDGIDVWVGSGPDRQVTGIVCSLDPYKRDAELKLLWCCTSDEIRQIQRFYDGQPMKVMLIRR